MIAARPFHRAARQPAIARPVSSSDRRVGVLFPASLPMIRQDCGRDARVPAFLANLLHPHRSSASSSRCREGMAPCGQRLTGNGQW